MKIDQPTLSNRLGSEIFPSDQRLTSDRQSSRETSSGLRLLDAPTEKSASSKIQESIPHVTCNLDEDELKLTKELTEAMFTVTTAEEQKESFKTYIRALQFLNVVLVPLNRGLYSSVLIQDLPLDSISPLGRMKFTLNSEMTLYGIGRAAGLKKRNGDEVKDFAPLSITPAKNVQPVDSLLPNTEGCPYTALYCHRNDRKESITIAEVDELLKQLPKSTLDTIRKPHFQTSLPSSPSSWSADCPLLTIQDNKQHLATATHHVKALTGEAQQALSDINALLNSGKVGKKITLQPGDALVLNNSRCLHGTDSLKAVSRLWLQSLLLIKADNSSATSNHLRPL